MPVVPHFGVVGITLPVCTLGRAASARIDIDQGIGILSVRQQAMTDKPMPAAGLTIVQADEARRTRGWNALPRQVGGIVVLILLAELSKSSHVPWVRQAVPS
jgi:hypothetical protein